MNLRLFSLCLLLFCLACHEKRPEKEIYAGIYHWKSLYDPEPKSQDKLKEIGLKLRYIRLFDIDFEKGQPILKSVLKFRQIPKNEIVPVIYITNRTFKNLPKDSLSAFAKKTAEKVKGIGIQNKLKYSEIQLDCDWSKSTATKYFLFITEFRKEFSSVAITATLRLHQVKFKEQTGVPPVDRTTLMLYNVGDWTKPETENSLFDPTIIDQYIFRLSEYPLPVDIALPIYTQCIAYRNGSFFTFLKNTNIAKLKKQLALEQKKQSNSWRLSKSADYENKSFRVGDVFREESANFIELNAVKNAVLARITNQNVKIVLYDLDEKSLSNFTNQELNALLEYTP